MSNYMNSINIWKLRNWIDIDKIDWIGVSGNVNIQDNIIGIIPHYIDKNNKNYKLLKTKLEKKEYIVKYIDIEVGNNYKKIIDKINNCKYIISSSLHGVIMGIIYKKTIYVEFSDKVLGNGFKFEDFFK